MASAAADRRPAGTSAAVVGFAHGAAHDRWGGTWIVLHRLDVARGVPRVDDAWGPAAPAEGGGAE